MYEYEVLLLPALFVAAAWLAARMLGLEFDDWTLVLAGAVMAVLLPTLQTMLSSDVGLFAAAVLVVLGISQYALEASISETLSFVTIAVAFAWIISGVVFPGLLP